MSKTTEQLAGEFLAEIEAAIDKHAKAYSKDARWHQFIVILSGACGLLSLAAGAGGKGFLPACRRTAALRQKRPFPQGRFLYDRDMPSFPNKEAALAGRISLAKSEATGCARADRELTISPALTDLAHTAPQIHADLVSPPEERRDWLSRA
jgi:hypothetical protein